MSMVVWISCRISVRGLCSPSFISTCWVCGQVLIFLRAMGVLFCVQETPAYARGIVLCVFLCVSLPGTFIYSVVNLLRAPRWTLKYTFLCQCTPRRETGKTNDLEIVACCSLHRSPESFHSLNQRLCPF